MTTFRDWLLRPDGSNPRLRSLARTADAPTDDTQLLTFLMARAPARECKNAYRHYRAFLRRKTKPHAGVVQSSLFGEPPQEPKPKRRFKSIAKAGGEAVRR